MLETGKRHFKLAYKWSLKPVRDISFSIHSIKIWDEFKKYISDNKTIIDLGCGAGVLLFNIKEQTKKYNNCRVMGYDFSEESICFAKEICPEVEFKIGDVAKTGFKDKTFDIVASTMTIEHVDDELFLREIARIIKENGTLFLTTIMKKAGAWYYLKNRDGESVLELTHLREYARPEEIVSLLKKNNFEIVLLDTPKIKFSLLDFILVRLGRILKNRYFSDLAAHPVMVSLRKALRIPVPGYFAIELIAIKK